ncbi:MAG: aminopeptidase P family protein, partial [Chlamydiae bacterium]|nr:aminopeptidase P family protein [Chlamydiota bacterium]
RRFFYWIPQQGTPVQIVHAIEPDVLEKLPGDRKIYQRWELLQKYLQETLRGVKVVAMEYSPYNRLPYISKVDGGCLDLVRSCGVEVVSSSSFLQYFTCILSQEQKASQKQAATCLHQIAEGAFLFLERCLKEGKKISEWDLQHYLLEKIEVNHLLVEDHLPICAFGVHTADPHYSPEKGGALLLEKNQPVLLDIVAKTKEDFSIYGDITRMAFTGKEPPQRLCELFQLALKAQEEAFSFIDSRLKKGESVKGYEVDQKARSIIEQAGYGEYFTHRTGHNIYETLHGPGAHLDGFETMDDRQLIPNTCFTIEPGIYIPGQIGVRVEYDVILHGDYTLEITSGVQKALKIIS